MKPYDIQIRMSAKMCLALMHGITVTRGQITDTFLFDYPTNAPYVSMRIMIPSGQEDKFEKASGIKLVKPPSPKSHIEGMGHN